MSIYLTVKDLRKALKNIPDDTELVMGLFGNQHEVSGLGIARQKENGQFAFVKGRPKRSDVLNFLIEG